MEKSHFRGVDTSNMQIWITDYHLQIYFDRLYFLIILIEI